MNQEQVVAEFIQWLPENIGQFQDIPDEIKQPIAAAKSADEVVNVLNELSKVDGGKELVTSLFQTFQQAKQQGMFKDGGKLSQLLKMQVGGWVRQRGEMPATPMESIKKFYSPEGWINVKGGKVKNNFRGKTLEQSIVTMGDSGVPRRVIRTITEYENPAKSDTTYTDALGTIGKRNPSYFDRFFGKTHSDEFMDRVDSLLEGMDPYPLNAKEARRLNKNKK